MKPQTAMPPALVPRAAKVCGRGIALFDQIACASREIVNRPLLIKLLAGMPGLALLTAAADVRIC